jgi:hypothetical protein
MDFWFVITEPIALQIASYIHDSTGFRTWCIINWRRSHTKEWTEIVKTKREQFNIRYLFKCSVIAKSDTELGLLCSKQRVDDKGNTKGSRLPLPVCVPYQFKSLIGSIDKVLSEANKRYRVVADENGGRYIMHRADNNPAHKRVSAPCFEVYYQSLPDNMIRGAFRLLLFGHGQLLINYVGFGHMVENKIHGTVQLCNRTIINEAIRYRISRVIEFKDGVKGISRKMDSSAFVNEKYYI